MGGRREKESKEIRKRGNREIPHSEEDNVWEGEGRKKVDPPQKKTPLPECLYEQNYFYSISSRWRINTISSRIPTTAAAIITQPTTAKTAFTLITI